MAIYKNTSQRQPQLTMMIRIFCVCGEGRGREESLDQWTTLWWWPQLLKSVSTRTPGQSCYMLSHQFQWNFASLKGLPQNSRRQTGFCFGFFRGEIDHPPRFSWFSPKKSLQNRQNVWSSHCDGIWPITLRVCTHIFTSLVNVRCKYQSIWLKACQSTEANKRLCF